LPRFDVLGQHRSSNGLPSTVETTFSDLFSMKPHTGIQNHFVTLGRIKNDFVASRAHSTNRSTIGLEVRFLSVTIATGQGRTGKSIGSSFRELKRTTDLEYAVMNEPLARKWLTRDVE